ncbi:MAG: right-handed parallel beta-helix repeat-containing protein, partial [Prevotellaceae bacterium]|nr:right-handed parallel beta-helix repeat-containing protein [Prevotellaceae bacterium]
MKQTGIIKRFIHIWILLMATAFYAGAQVSLQANNDEMWTGPFEKVRKNIIKNDVIPGDTYDWTIVTASLPNPAKGVFVKDGNFLVFTPNASCKNENVSIEYKLVSGMETSTATVTIHVSELNSPVNMIYPDAECVSPMTGVVEFTPSLKFTTDDDHNDGFSTPLIGDLNGDGKPEIVALGVDEGGAVLAYGRYIKIYDGQTGAQLINFDLQGLGGDYASTSQFFLRSVPYHNAPSNLAIADLDRDGIGEIVVCETGSNGRVYALKPTLNSTTKAFISPYLSKIWDASVSFKAPLTTTWDGGYGRPMPYIADLNGDGIPEVIVYNKIYNGQNGKLLMAWNGAASSSTASSIVSGTGLLVYRDASPFTESTDATDIRNRAMTGRRPANSSYADDYVAVSSIVDIDGDGTQEIITGNRIYKIQINNLNDHTLNTYTTIEGPVSVTLPVSTSKSTTETYYLHDGFTRVADIDGDGYLDIVVTTFVDGSLNPTILVYVWDPRFPAVVKAALTYWGDGGDGNYGIPFIGDINGKNDGWTGSAYTKKLPEICIISGSVYINRVEDNSGRSGIKFHGLSDGQLRQGVNFDNNNTSASDRRFNRRINSSDYYGHIIGLTYDASSTNIEDRLRLSWAMEHHDGSDNTGISMFDFNNDGASDLCYQDQHSLRVISPKKGNIDYVDINATAGTNASILFNEAVNSYTAFEPPVIADVNLDGSADIVVVHSSSSTCSRGKIRVYEHASGTPMWAPCPPVWNQGMYDPLQINENLTVPALPQSMLTPYKDKDDNTIYPYNAQWAQQPIVMLDEKYIPQVRKPDANAVLLHMTVKVLSNPARAAISFNVFNGGSATINANTPVSFYDGGTGGLGIGTGATLIGTQPIGVDIFSGEEVTRPFIINGNFNNHLLWARIVDDGTSFPAAGYLECDPTNNVYSGIDCPDLIYNVTVAPDAELCGIDDFATLTAVPENPQGAPTFQWYRNNVILENETSATLNATLAGTYKCYVVDGICRGFSSEMTITRSNYISYVTPSGGGDKDGSSWENAYQGLADALQTAASGTKCIREIWVAEGTYYPKYQAGTGTGITDRDKAFVMVEGVKIYGGFNGTLTGTPTVVPQFGATGRTGRSILSGDIDGNNTTDAGNVYHVVIAAGNGTTTYPYITDAACLDGFTVTGGYSYDLSGSQTILVNGVAVERTNGAGVAIYNSTPKIAYDTITGNRCGGNSSSSYDGYGGGIYATSTTTDTIKITNTVISNNTSNFYGGGIACDNINMTMTYSSVENNTATGNAAGGSGGGIFYRSSSKKLTLTNVTIKGNKAYSEVASGGGLQCICSTNLSSCTLSAELTNVAITGNLAESPSSTSFGAQGGGIYFDKSMALINVTIAGNNVINPTTAGGGGVDCSSGSTTNFSNCIIWGNRKAGTTVSNVPATGATYNYTLLEGTVPAGTGNKTGDPKFIAFMAASSAPTDGGDYRLQSDSPAIDAGNNSANTTPFDLAGSARKQGNAIDMGAYEYGISITGQPKPQTMLNVNCSDFLSIEASMDGGTLTYQWYSNTTPTNSGGTLISGATGKTLTIPATTYTIGTPHYYYCVVSATGISPLPTPASSNVATVTMLTKVVRYVKEGGTTVNDGISWATASGDLQAMINASCADDEIWVAAGTYKPIYTADGWNSSTKVYPNTGGGRDNAFVLKEGVTIYGGFQATGNPGFDDRQPISDNVDYKTILSGDIDDATNNDVYHVVVAANLDTALLDGFTITGAYNNVTVAGSITVNTRPVTRNYGGGIYVNGSMYFSNLKVINNTAFVMGGGAYLEPVNISEGAVFTNVAFLGNSVISDGVADGGGGICVNNGTHSMTNLLIAGNNATVIGGGILFRNVVSSNSTLTNITVAGNNAGNMGGGIYNGGSTVNIRNSVIWGNTANQVPVTNNIYDNNNITHSYNLVQNGSVSGTEIISNADPLFVSSIDYRLQSGSPAIDKGNNAHIAGFTTDLDGSLRIQGCRVDLGAYETKGVTPDANGIVYVNLLKNGNGLSWDNAYPNLADVLAAAEIGKNLCEGEIKEIWVAEGTYYPKYKAAEKDNLNNPTTDRDKAFVMVAGVKIYGGFTGDGTEDEITDRVTIANEHGFWQMVNKTILSGDIGTPNDVSDNVHHVVIAAGNMTVGGVTARLDGFTVTGGNAERLSSIFVNGVEISSTYSGGGITVIQASPVIINDSIADNKTSNSNGGGIHIYNGSNPVVTHTVINNNTASFNGGGVAIEESSNPVFSYTVIKNNISETAFGGGVSIIESSLAKFTNTVISGNTAPNGGGVAVRYNNTNNMPEFINTKIIGNTAIGDGGNGNGRGGGMQFMNGFAKVTNTLISGNTAYYYGGGVFVDGGDPEFINATIAGNYAANSGGLYNDGSNNGTVKLYNTIIYGNTGSINLGSYTAGNSLVQGVTLTGTGNFSNATNPLFVSLDQATLSTPTIGGDYHLNPLSPVVNAGDDSKNDEPYDLDGADRKQGTIDLGVYENEIEIIANDDYVAVAAPAIAKPVKIDVLANDLIPAGCTPVTITIDENGLHGNAVVNAAGDTVIYTPNNGYYGLDTLKYRVACGGTDATAYVYISVQEYPDNV